jgi:hypothetical protein
VEGRDDEAIARSVYSTQHDQHLSFTWRHLSQLILVPVLVPLPASLLSSPLLPSSLLIYVWL